MIGKRLRVRDAFRPAAVLAIVAAVLLSGPLPASAHSELERSDPPDGGMVAEGRTSITLWFAQPVTAESTFELRTQEGTPIPVTAAPASADAPGFVQLETEPLVRGTYVLDWAVVSADDGHPSTGSVLFGAGIRPAGGAADAAGLPNAPTASLRWLDLLAIMTVIGALVVSGRVLGSMGPAGAGPRRRALVIGGIAATAAVLAGIVTPALRTSHGAEPIGTWIGATWTGLVSTEWGRLWLVRELALVALAAVLWSRVRRSSSTGRLGVALPLLAIVVLIEARTGHASALPGRSAFAEVASAMHLVAAGVWAGGLVVLVCCLLPVMRRDPESRGPILASAWSAFSPIAGVATVVLVATGIYEMGRHLPGLGAMTATVYGRAAGSKLLLVGIALALAAGNALLVNPNLAAPVGKVLRRPIGWSPVSLRRFPAVVAAELVVLVVAVAAAAVLTSVPTARELDIANEATTPTSTTADGWFVTFEAVPTEAGRSLMIVRTRAIVRPAVAPVTGVTVQLTGSDGTGVVAALTEIEPGRYQAVAPELAPGAWQAEVKLQRRAYTDAVASLPWTVAAPDGDRIGPLELGTSAIAIFLLTALAAVIVALRRPRSAQPTTATVTNEMSEGYR